MQKRVSEVPTGYTETHHILPRCLGGDNSKDNLVKLTAREHFIAHLLLTKCYEVGTIEYYKMVHAFYMMLNAKSNNQERLITSKKYEHLKTAQSTVMSLNQKGSSNSQYGTRWVYNPTTQECKKILCDETLPNGFVYGRTVKNCQVCSIVLGLKVRSRYCSEICKSRAKVNRSKKGNEFLELYHQYTIGKYKSIRQFAKTTNYSHTTLSRNFKNLTYHV